MPSTNDDRMAYLGDHAGAYLRLACDNIIREYPVSPWIVADGPADYRLHREDHPAFYGSFDWHSCVEMFWAAIRILRLFPDLAGRDDALAMLDAHLTRDRLAAEAAYFADDRHRGFERPYGWGWLLALWHELSQWSDPRAAPWHADLAPLANVIMDRLDAWLPHLTYPQRIGMHANTAFGLTMAWDAMAAARPALLATCRQRAIDWFGRDADYPFAYEPSGADFLSAGLCEAVLISRVLEPATFAAWFKGFFPTAAEHQPASIFVPAEISDPTDGQIAHLHGLNLSRAWAFFTLADVLGPDDPRHVIFHAAADRHASASLDDVAGSHYMVEHWLMVYAVLYLTA